MAAFITALPIADTRARRSVTRSCTVSNYANWSDKLVMRLRPRSRIEKVANAVEDARALWRRAGAKEKAGFVAVAAGAATVAGAGVVALAHVSATIALFAVPLMLAPAIFTVAAAFGAVVLAAGMGVAGSALLFAPALAAGAALKIFGELALVAALGGALYSAAGWVFKDDGGGGGGKEEKYRRTDDTRREGRVGGVPFVDNEPSWSEEMFRSFDRALHERESNANGRWGKSIRDLPRWSVDDVVDELVAVGLGQFAQLFDAERVDGAALLALREDDLRAELSGRAPLGARVKLWRWIEDMQEKHRNAR